MVKVSIIVPVFNNEMYLKRCLESICTQTYDNLEIILVNDGSTDSSLNICKYFKQNDKRIIIIDKNNEGQGKARNEALKIMTGDYVLFCDSDDCINIHMVEELLRVSMETNADIVQCGYIEKEFNEHIDYNQILHITDCDFIEERKFGEERALCYYTEDVIPVNKLISSDLIKGYFFPEDIYYEDKHLMFRLRHLANKIVYVRTKFYYYVQSANSTMRNELDEKRIKSSFIVSKYLLSYCLCNNLKENYQSELGGYLRKLLSIYFYTLKKSQYANFNYEAELELKKYLSQLKHNKYVPSNYKLLCYILDYNFSFIHILYVFNKLRKIIGQ